MSYISPYWYWSTDYCKDDCCDATTPDCCNGQDCVDLYSDPFNCGECGNACTTGQSCMGGRCRQTPSYCQPGEVFCSNVCVDLANDEDNCGTCGHSCGVDQTTGEQMICRNGQCTISGTGCVGAAKGFCLTSLGANVCVDFSTDNDNCGDCGISCGSNGQCINGQCECKSNYRDCDPTDSTFCETQLGTVAACGGCGQQCQALTQTCTNKKCVCLQNRANCDRKQSNGCEVDLLTDRNNCGACNKRCEGSCVGGACVCSSISLTACGSRCIDLARDPRNCGQCGHSCDNDEVCDNGKCVEICGDSDLNDFCPNMATSEKCTNILTDSSNCGTCGNVCPWPKKCANGRCVCPTAGAVGDSCNDVCGCAIGLGCYGRYRQCGACPECAAATATCVCNN